VRGGLRELGLNYTENAIDVPEHVIIPEAEHLVPLLSQTFITNSIGR